jgi:ferrous iron transport protein A
MALKRLTEMKEGETGKIANIEAGRTATQRLVDMGLTIGTGIRVKEIAPFKGPVGVCVRDTCVALGYGLASKVLVEVEDGQK